MMNSQINNMIGELIEPDPIRSSFSAPGWTILLVLMGMGFLCFGLWKLYQYRKNKYRRVAIKEICKMTIGEDASSRIILNTITLLKRVAITAYGREVVASMYGEDFLGFLQAKTPKTSFSDENKLMFTKYLYQGNKVDVSHDQLELLRKESINWINMHHV